MVRMVTIAAASRLREGRLMAKSDLAELILVEIDAKPLRLAEIAACVGRQARDGSVRRALAKLVESGQVMRDGALYVRMAPAGTSGILAPEGATPPPPDGLGDAGREVWSAAHMVDSTRRPDRGVVLHLARLEDESVRMIDLIEKEGPVQRVPIVSPRGGVVGHRLEAHPLIASLRKVGAEILIVRSAIGLDPRSRASLGLTHYGDRPDAIDELQERRRLRLEATPRRQAAEGQ